ncbi:MAG: type II toxin-antitoxin system PemK/MazF family toxin [Alphaproteobacteria bacterium]
MAGFDNRSGFSFGDIVLAPYVMPSQQAAEHQPCVVISSSTYNQQRAEVLTMAIVTQARPDASSGEMAVLMAEAAGLDRGAAFKPVLMTIEQRLVRLILGRLESRDRERLHHLLDLIVG